MKRFLLAFLILGNLTVLRAAEPAVGETICDSTDEKCCERVANEGKKVDDTTVVAPKPAGEAESTRR